MAVILRDFHILYQCTLCMLVFPLTEDQWRPIKVAELVISLFTEEQFANGIEISRSALNWTFTI